MEPLCRPGDVQVDIFSFPINYYPEINRRLPIFFKILSIDDRFTRATHGNLFYNHFETQIQKVPLRQNFETILKHKNAQNAPLGVFLDVFEVASGFEPLYELLQSSA